MYSLAVVLFMVSIIELVIIVCIERAQGKRVEEETSDLLNEVKAAYETAEAARKRKMQEQQIDDFSRMMSYDVDVAYDRKSEV